MGTLKFGAIIIGFCVLLLWAVTSSEKASQLRREKGDEYDERQRLVRGEAYRQAAIAAFVFLCVEGILSMRRPWLEDPLDRVWLVWVVAFFVFSLKTIRYGAFFKLGTNLNKQLIFRAFFAVMDVVIAANCLYRGNLVQNGLLTTKGAIFIMGLLDFPVRAAMVDCLLRLRREELEED